MIELWYTKQELLKRDSEPMVHAMFSILFMLRRQSGDEFDYYQGYYWLLQEHWDDEWQFEYYLRKLAIARLKRFNHCYREPIMGSLERP